MIPGFFIFLHYRADIGAGVMVCNGSLRAVLGLHIIGAGIGSACHCWGCLLGVDVD